MSLKRGSIKVNETRNSNLNSSTSLALSISLWHCLSDKYLSSDEHLGEHVTKVATKAGRKLKKVLSNVKAN